MPGRLFLAGLTAALIGAASSFSASVSPASAESAGTGSQDPAAASPAPARLGPAPAAAAPLEAARLLRAQTRLGLGLLEKLQKADKDARNIVVSPASVAAVFGLLELGADGAMRTALHKTLGFDGNAAGGDLAGVRAALVAPRPAQGPLSLASAMVIAASAKPYPLALIGLRAVGAEVSVEDLSKPETLVRINEWVSARTGGLIPTILSDPPRDADLVALSALHFKDRWKIPFEAERTAPGAFLGVDGKPRDVPMMKASGAYTVRESPQFVAVDLGYMSADYALVVITTRDKPERMSGFSGVEEWLTGAGFTARAGDLTLPRFTASGAVELLPALDALGLKAGRRSRTALGGLLADPQTIARVIQRTVLKVDEEGSEAAAATAVITARGISPEFFSMVVDKPFVFALRERSSGAVLLAGYVGEPQ